MLKYSAPNSGFLVMCMAWEATGDAQSGWVPTTIVGVSHWIIGYHLFSSNSYCEHLKKWTSRWALSLCLPLPPSINKNINDILGLVHTRCLGSCSFHKLPGASGVAAGPWSSLQQREERKCNFQSDCTASIDSSVAHTELVKWFF